MKQNQNTRQNRQGRSNQYNNQKRPGKGRHNNNRNQQPNTASRQIDSRGPGGNQRGNAKQLYEKYKIMAQERRASDRLESESLNQHADHYYRIYAEFAATEAASQAIRDQAQDQAQEQAKEQERARKAQKEAERQVNSEAQETGPESSPPEQAPEAVIRKPRGKPAEDGEVKTS